MRWLEGSSHTFTSPVNQTDPDAAVRQLIERGRFFDGNTMWNPAPNGKPSAKLIGKLTSNEDVSDCMAIVLTPDGKQTPAFVNCQQSKADQAICVRDGLSSTKSGPCALDLSYEQLTGNTDVLGVAAILSAVSDQQNQFFYAERVSDAKQSWLMRSRDISTFMLPSAERVYFLVLCKPGWFPLPTFEYPISTATCKNGSSRSTSTRGQGTMCGHYDGCQYPKGEKSFFKGTHITHCSSQGYCVPHKAHGNFSCNCQLGFKGASCDQVDVDPCNDTRHPNRCGLGQVCVAQQHDYYCECKGKLAYNKYDCQYEVDECINNPCRNNASCVTSLSTFYCECKDLEDPITKQKVRYTSGAIAKWGGILCDRDPINSCQPNPCVGKPGGNYIELYGRSPAGTCRDEVNGFTCACDYPWSGSICEVYDSENIVQAVTGRRLSLIYAYLALFITFNISCMLLTMLRRREIGRGRYQTEEMIVAAYESEKKVERDKLMQFVEDAAYSSEEEDERAPKRVSSAHARSSKISNVGGPRPSTTFSETRSRFKSSAPSEVSPSGINLHDYEDQASRRRSKPKGRPRKR